MSAGDMTDPKAFGGRDYGYDPKAKVYTGADRVKPVATGYDHNGLLKERTFYLNNSGSRFVRRPNPLIVRINSNGEDIPGAKPFRARYFEAFTAFVVAIKRDGTRVPSFREVN